MRLLTKASYSGEVSKREKENLEVAYRAACEGMVLLKNDGTLPLTTKKIALYGPGASMTIKGGTGSGDVYVEHIVGILEGMDQKVTDKKIKLQNRNGAKPISPKTKQNIKALKFLLGFIALIAYELFLDGSGIGMKQRWSKLKEWSQK